MIGVLVAAIDQLAETVAALRQGVVAAAEVERPDGVVTGADREDPYAGGRRRGVAGDGCFAGGGGLAPAGAGGGGGRRPGGGAGAGRRSSSWRRGRWLFRWRGGTRPGGRGRRGAPSPARAVRAAPARLTPPPSARRRDRSVRRSA